ncbi:hypothetical protein ACBJ59_58915 [Nonomuraea sp. MTCD27]|uniref:hypothetical protein n=1 Tax=Nonomuraea sp. MTCD27 TaxID=1676747 RepID=UPI0035C2612F
MIEVDGFGFLGTIAARNVRGAQAATAAAVEDLTGRTVTGWEPDVSSRSVLSRLICRVMSSLTCGSPVVSGVVTGLALSFQVADFVERDDSVGSAQAVGRARPTVTGVHERPPENVARGWFPRAASRCLPRSTP